MGQLLLLKNYAEDVRTEESPWARIAVLGKHFREVEEKQSHEMGNMQLSRVPVERDAWES